MGKDEAELGAGGKAASSRKKPEARHGGWSSRVEGLTRRWWSESKIASGRVAIEREDEAELGAGGKAASSRKEPQARHGARG